MKVSLVIMAAGLGSRYGGSKQIDGIGPHNEILMEYGIYDALRAGFNKVVFIIKPDMAELMDRLCGDYLREMTALDGNPVEVEYVFQDFSSVPDFYEIPEGRTKPFGTVHALLCAADVVKEPFCVINADDYYGMDAYTAIYDALLQLPEQGKATMVGYLLKNTASLHGTVSRGVCEVDGDKLCAVHETKKIQLYADGTLKDLERDRELNPESVVSMNFWGFMPSIFGTLKDYFDYFLRELAGDDLKAECLLPVMVDYEMKKGELEVSVLNSVDKWFGMTYQEDRLIVAKELKQLHAEGRYPESLREN
jgi:NDP-sugar pyrophosphorylase family protein